MIPLASPDAHVLFRSAEHLPAYRLHAMCGATQHNALQAYL